MFSEFFAFAEFTIALIISLFFVLAGKYDSDGLYVVSLIAYVLTFMSMQTKYIKLSKRLRKYKKAADRAVRLAELNNDSEE